MGILPVNGLGVARLAQAAVTQVSTEATEKEMSRTLAGFQVYTSIIDSIIKKYSTAPTEPKEKFDEAKAKHAEARRLMDEFVTKFPLAKTLPDFAYMLVHITVKRIESYRVFKDEVQLAKNIVAAWKSTQEPKPDTVEVDLGGRIGKIRIPEFNKLDTGWKTYLETRLIPLIDYTSLINSEKPEDHKNARIFIVTMLLSMKDSNKPDDISYKQILIGDLIGSLKKFRVGDEENLAAKIGLAVLGIEVGKSADIQLTDAEAKLLGISDDMKDYKGVLPNIPSIQ